jgi:hypothetical protein
MSKNTLSNLIKGLAFFAATMAILVTALYTASTWAVLQGRLIGNQWGPYPTYVQYRYELLPKIILRHPEAFRQSNEQIDCFFRMTHRQIGPIILSQCTSNAESRMDLVVGMVDPSFIFKYLYYQSKIDPVFNARSDFADCRQDEYCNKAMDEEVARMTDYRWAAMFTSGDVANSCGNTFGYQLKAKTMVLVTCQSNKEYKLFHVTSEYPHIMQ